IHPGVEVRIIGASKDNIFNFFWSGNNQPIAKMIVVFGRINAFGTEDQPITFDVHSDDPSFRWGGLNTQVNAQMSSFEYCTFKRAYRCFVTPGTWSFGAIAFNNGSIHMRYCTFIDNLICVGTTNVTDDILIYGCKFYSSASESSDYLGFSVNSPEPPERNYNVTIANCYFTGPGDVGGAGKYINILYLNNTYEYVGSNRALSEQSREVVSEFGIYSTYGNFVLNGKGPLGCGTGIEGEVTFCRRNTMIVFPDNNYTNARAEIGIGGRAGTNHVSDNYLNGAVRIYTVDAHRNENLIYNNIILTTVNKPIDLSHPSGTAAEGELSLFNNLVVNINPIENYFNSLLFLRYTNPYIYNNTFSGFFGGSDNFYSGIRFYNNIFYDFVMPPSPGDNQNYPNIYGYNCVDQPLPQFTSIIDTGGNIVADPLFTDPEAGDYTLQGDSPCIDTGLNLPELPTFDIRYHKRMAPGTVDGHRQVDMGAFEYNSVYIGGIRVFVYDAVTGLAVDCVKAEINGKLPEFTNSLGRFHYPTGAGTYSMMLSRWDYVGTTIENIVVSTGEDLLLEIPLYREGASNQDEDGGALPKLLSLTNYPNPFNPQTRIGYILPTSGHVRLSIYNTRGQRLHTLIDAHQERGHQSAVWKRRDESGRNVSSGIYYARLEYAGRSATKKMMLVK
ncbi:MAG: T9SS type A sorting domain-containing protein, partial [Candidatus Cloacimonadaceae bacterium]|nr:T9SS type A sorting domain-containing protein [Candidatus Cloacimonadaceae bacterium]